MKLSIFSVILSLSLLTGCSTHPIDSTPPLASIVTKEVKVPVAVCPAEIATIASDPVRPHLNIDDLSPTDQSDYKKVGLAYMQSIAALKQYSETLEHSLKATKDICQSVNTTTTGQ